MPSGVCSGKAIRPKETMIERSATFAGRIQRGFADIDGQQCAAMRRQSVRQHPLGASDLEPQFVDPIAERADAVVIFALFIGAALQVPGVVRCPEHALEIV